MLKNSLIAAGLAGLVFAAQPAMAQSASNPDLVVQHRLVPYADLDLSTAADQARLDGRLRRAAAAVCEANYGPHPLSESLEARRCYRNALQSAQRTVATLGMARVAAR